VRQDWAINAPGVPVPLTDDNYITAIAAGDPHAQQDRVRRREMTYGDLAKVVGYWDGKGHYPKAVDKLFHQTEARFSRESLKWDYFVNAAAGQPGACRYAEGF
jgi:hypothetical protein